MFLDILGDRSEVVRNSVLSVDAAEFVPKSLVCIYFHKSDT